MKFSALAAGGVLLGSASGTIHRVKLHKTPLEQQLSYATVEEHVQALGQKYMGPMAGRASPDPVRGGDTHAEDGHIIPIENFLNTQYFSVIEIGSKSYKVMLDTASPNLWVPPSARHSAEFRDASTSSLLQSSSSTCPGFMSHDTVTIGDIVIRKQEYCQKPTARYPPFDRFDGIFGLPYDTGSTTGDVPPFSSMFNDGLIAEPVFAFHLGDADKDEGSEVTFGGIDEKHFTGPMTKLPVHRRKIFWEVDLDGISFGSESAKFVHTGAILDTGTSFLALPSSIAQLLNSEIGVKKSSNGQYSVDCDRRKLLPYLTFKLGGHNFTLTAEDYILEAQGSCFSAIRAMDVPTPVGPVAVLGDAFLRRWYSVYDLGNDAVGLARSA